MSKFQENSAGFLANHMARAFAAELHRQIKPLGLAPAQFMVLLELWGQDGLTQKELVARLDVEQATMANTLSRMARDGLVLRQPSKQDARSRLIMLTPKARALQVPAIAAAKGLNQRALSVLSDAEQEQFLSMMRRVLAQLRAGR